MQVDIVQNVNEKVAGILHVTVIGGISRRRVIQLYMHKPSHNNLDNDYDFIGDLTLEDIIQ